MKHIKTIFITIILLFAMKLNAQETYYTKAWKEVEVFDNKELPKSALEATEKIYNKAQAENNHQQMLKAFIYKLKYMQALEDEGDQKVIDKIDEEIARSKFPAKNILYSIKAESYWKYYEMYQFRILSRKNTVNIESKDIATLSENQIIDIIIRNYNLSLSDADKLLNIKKKEYQEIIEKGKNADGIFTTLYDFLAHRAFKFFTQGDFRLQKAADFFQINNEKYFLPADEFVNIKIEKEDSLSVDYQTVNLFKNWLKLHLNDKNKKTLLHINLLRLNYIYNNAVLPNKDELYVKALQNLQSKHENIEEFSEISYYLAQYYYDKSENYNVKNPLTAKFKDFKQKSLKICENAIKKYPKSFGAKGCKHLKSKILKISLNFKVENVVQPKTNFPILINYQNNKKVYAMIGKISMETYNKIYNGHNSNTKFLKKLKKAAKIVQKNNVELKNADDHNEHSTELIMKGLDIGNYVVFISNNPDFKYDHNTVSYRLISVSNLSYITRDMGDGNTKVCVLNRTNGKPIEGAKAEVWTSSYNYSKHKYVDELLGKFTSDKNGIFYVKNTNQYSTKVEVKLFYKDDYLKLDQSIRLHALHSPNKNEEKVYLYTDRAIYRPGQTLYFKGILLETDGDKHKLLDNKKVEVELYDANYQLVAKQKFTSNQYGSISGNFALPNYLLNGSMHLRCLNGNKFFIVEEYKRPKFKLDILPLKGNYILNDMVSVRGKATAYSGASVSDAKVKYSIVRKPIFNAWWWGFLPQTETQIATGYAKTDAKGEFAIDFKAVPDLNYAKSDYLQFTYSITIDVTDIDGETQTTTKNMNVGYTALQMSIDIDELQNKDSLKLVDINTENVNGEFVPAVGEIKIYSLKQLKTPLRNRVWDMPDEFLYTKNEWEKLYPGNEYKNENSLRNRETKELLFSSKFNTAKDKKIDLSKIKDFKSGIYVVKLSSKDAFGNKVEHEKFFTLYSTKTDKLPAELMSWFTPVKTTCEPGEKAQFLLGSSISNLNVFYEIEHKGKIIKKEVITTNGKQKLVEIPVIEDYRGNFVVHFLFLYNNRVYAKSFVVEVPRSNKKLNIVFETFRDKLLPGAEEEWKIKISGHKNEKVAAEMLASMYDASLDKFAQDKWKFDIYKSYYSSLAWQYDIFDVESGYVVSSELNSFVSMPYRRTSYLNWFGTYLFAGRIAGLTVGYARPPHRLSKSKSAQNPLVVRGAAPMAMGVAELEEKIVAEDAETPNFATKTAKTDMGNVKIRSNFSETAFFYPNLQTNEKGELLIKFKVPESLTTWKMRGFAYSKNLEYGFVEKELKTQKDLMVVANAPRFFRQNDEIEFPVKISNLSKTKQSGTVRLEFFDAITMKPINDIFGKKGSQDKEFSVDNQVNTVVNWNLKIPEFNGALMYRVTAKSGNFSDGEQKAVPVLTDRILVTESLPLSINGEETKTFKFSKLLKSKRSKSLQNFKLTLEFSSNPAWYAVQALPYLIENNSECSEQIFARYYANSIAHFVANSSPKIKRVFDSWKHDANSQSLLSNLEKNQELKSALLEETPWVFEATDERERKNRIALLFDFNKMANDLQAAQNKLQQAQKPNGAWAWFEGMPESRYITQYIVAGFGHLKHLKILKAEGELNAMLNNAVEYLDQEIAAEYTKLKKKLKANELKKNNLSHIAIHYLYARSFFTDIPINKKSQEAVDYFTAQSKKYWVLQSLYSKGMLALYLNRYNEKSTAQEILKSLKEFAITKDELGMYWKENTSGYFWYQAPIETQALMIEVFSELGGSQKDIENLKIWLLKQKQTQDWKTSKATVEAVYALLASGSNWLENDNLVDIKIDDQAINPNKMDNVKVEAGTGYFKTSWLGGDIKPDMGKIKLQKKDKGVAWGALYWQYFEDLDKITAHNTALQINKQLFVERTTKDGKIIEPVGKKTKLELGDKVIVRIEIRTDRDMEYVHLKDMRASTFEPINVLSRYKYKGGLGYYESTKDASSNFFIYYLRKGTYVFEYPLRVSYKGDFSNGITTIQCMYAPEFSSHSKGVKVKVK